MSCTLEWSSIRWSSHNHSANDAAARTINEPHHPKKRQDNCFNIMLHIMFDNLLDFCCYLKQAARPTTPPQASSFFKKLAIESLFFAKYFRYSRSFQSLRVEGQNSLLLDILYTASAGFLYPSYTLSQHTLSLSFHLNVLTSNCKLSNL